MSVNDRIDTFSSRLGTEQDLSKRAKKRILQKLGKLNKQKLQCENGAGEPLAKKQKVEKSLSRKEAKNKLNLLNKDLAEFSHKKQLKRAEKRFSAAINAGIQPDILSYSNLINAYSRCNDMVGATKALERMSASGIPVNLVVQTTLLKGYCEIGDMKSARKLYFLDIICPNDRTLNTLLRGCLRTGSTNTALTAFFNMFGNNSGFPDSSTLEYIITLLTMSGHGQIADRVMEEFVLTSKSQVAAGGVIAIENGAIYLTLAKYACKCGNILQAKQWLQLVSSVLEAQERQGSVGASMFAKIMQEEASPEQEKDKGNRSVALFLQHRNLEMQHEQRMLEDYISFAESKKLLPAQVAADGMSYLRLLLQDFKTFAVNLHSTCSMLYFGFDGMGDVDDLHSLSLAPQTEVYARYGWKWPKRADAACVNECAAVILLRALLTKFHLESASAKVDANADEVKKRFDAVRKQVAASKAQLREKIVTGYLRGVRDEQLDLNLIERRVRCKSFEVENEEEVAENINVDVFGLSSTKAAKIPIKLEICSGHGDWVVAQADSDWRQSSRRSEEAADRECTGIWLALELRCDRSHEIVTKARFSDFTNLTRLNESKEEEEALLQSVVNDNVDSDKALAVHLKKLGDKLLPSNLMVLSGDASKILPQRIPPGSISQVFINYPQPPDRVSAGNKHEKRKARNADQGAHLLTAAFFMHIYHALSAKGTVTIVTDNLLYGKLLGSTMAELGCFRSVEVAADQVVEETYPVANCDAKIVLCRGKPGPEIGHIAPTASYFDRMWSLGQKKRRWILFVEKFEST